METGARPRDGPELGGGWSAAGGSIPGDVGGASRPRSSGGGRFGKSPFFHRTSGTVRDKSMELPFTVHSESLQSTVRIDSLCTVQNWDII
jgi:hypothetical protein